MKKQSAQGELPRIKRWLLFYETATIILAICVTILVLFNFSAITNAVSKIIVHAVNNQAVPHYKKVMKIIGHLKYSGLRSLLKPDVKMGVDFENGMWYLHNIHKYNKEGDIILENENEGLCGELAAYVYKRVRPLFDEKYTIKFVKVAESGFFLSPKASHIVLLITKRLFMGVTKTYIIDPSFNRYGNTEDFDDYIFIDTSNMLSIIEKRLPDVYFSVDSSAPILINHAILISILVGKTNDKFDKDNFCMGLIATSRYKFSGRYIFAMRREDGKDEVFENAHLARLALDNGSYKTLRKRISEWYNSIAH